MTAISTALVIAAIAGLAAIFIARPLQRFYELREVCRHQMLNSANVSVPDTGPDAALRAHQLSLRDLGARMLAFADTRTIAVFVVKAQGYDPALAGAGLVGLSNALPKYGAERLRWRTQIEQALRFPK